jgi:hypothetical protein
MHLIHICFCPALSHVQVNSRTIQPMLVSALREKGFGELLDSGFTCSPAWIRKLCRAKLQLRVRAATSAAQKLPPDADQQVKLFKLRLAHLVYKHKIDKRLVGVCNDGEGHMHLCCCC